MKDEKETTAEVMDPPHPTEPDVVALMETTSKMEEGAVFSHDGISSTINELYGSYRYRTVVRAWIKRERQQKNRDWKAVPRVGYELLPPQKRVWHSIGHQVSSSRKLCVAREIAAGTDEHRLDSSDKATRGHLLKTTAAMIGMANAFQCGLKVEMKKYKQLAASNN